MRFLPLVLSALGVNAQFDFGGGGGSGCDGSGSFQQQIKKDTRTLVGDVPKGLKGLKITLQAVLMVTFS